MLRLKKSMTLKQAANAVKISESHFCLIESGQRDPHVNTAKRIAKVLSFDWTRFFEEEK